MEQFKNDEYDWLLFSIFRDRAMKLARFQHRIFPIDPESLRVVAQTVAVPFGVWNARLPDDNVRAPRSPGTEWPLIEGFRLWAEEENQLRARQYLDRTDPHYFTMLIDATTSTDLLTRLWKEAPVESERASADAMASPHDVLTEYWGDYWDWLSRWIGELGWACVGTFGWSDMDYGVFVANDAKTTMVSSLAQHLESVGREVAWIELIDHKASWTGPLRPR